MLANDHVLMVLQLQDNAAKRGQLTMWTIFDHPNDYPDTFVARRFEVGKQGVQATDCTLFGAAAVELQNVFREAGLIRVCRQPGDDPVILETWS